MDQRYEFVHLAIREEANISTLSKRFNISRKTAYKWLTRYHSSGTEGLKDLTRRPRSYRNPTLPEVVEAIIAVREKHSSWGGRKIRRTLQNKQKRGLLNKLQVPSASTITHILKLKGYITDEASEASKHHCRFEHEHPNDLWQMDFKGDVTLSNRQVVYPLTILDDHSRFNLCLQSCGNKRRNTVHEHMAQAFTIYGLPFSMLMDNGNPWSDGSGSLTRIVIWLLRLGIRVLHGRPYHPQTQGKEERFHRTLKTEVLNGRLFPDQCSLQKAFDQWRQIYNYERPHDALNLDAPGNRYTVSPRRYPEKLPPIEYDSSELVRKVRGIGYFSFNGCSWYLSEALTGENIALRPTGEDGLFLVCYGCFAIGALNCSQPLDKGTHYRRIRIFPSARYARFGEYPSLEAMAELL
jgi:transposase InsO family protein